MMRVQFKLDYGTVLNGNHAAVEALVRRPIELDENNRVKDWFNTYDADLRELMRLVPADKIKLVEPEPNSLLEVTNALLELGAKVDAMRPAFNERVQVVVPGLALMEVRHVVVRYDMCTDALQEELDAGWRILAVCPQPDQRRPDYILGRSSL